MSADEGPHLGGSGSTEGRVAAPGRLLPFLAALAATAALLVLVLSLGSWGYKYRRWLFHHVRLQRALERHPPEEDLGTALEGEGARALGQAATPAELERIATGFPPAVRERVAAKGARAREVRVFGAGEMVYFVFFDRDRKMADFLVVEKTAQP